MAKTFKPFTSEGSSWADDDDDIDVALPIAPLKLPESVFCPRALPLLLLQATL